MPDHEPTAADLARDLDADLALCESATPGPWHAWSHPGQATLGPPFGNVAGLPRVAVDRCEYFRPGDAAFIAAAREGWPAALAEVARLRALLAPVLDAPDYDELALACAAARRALSPDPSPETTN